MPTSQAARPICTPMKTRLFFITSRPKEQQKNAASLGMWLFLAQEVMFFGGMFCAYLIYRYKYFGDFGAASQTLDIKWGAINTAVLICSSLTVVLAVRAAQLGKRKALVGWLLLTIVLGVAFLGIKGIEYAEKFEKHHVPGSSFAFIGTVPSHPDLAVNSHHAEMYFSLYFAMTGMHALHMIIGIGIFRYARLLGLARQIFAPIISRPLKMQACIGTLSISSGSIFFHCSI